MKLIIVSSRTFIEYVFTFAESVSGKPVSIVRFSSYLRRTIESIMKWIELNSPFFRACKNPWPNIFVDRSNNVRVFESIYIFGDILRSQWFWKSIRDTRYGANTSHIPSVRSRLKERIKRKEKVVRFGGLERPLYLASVIKYYIVS